MYPLDNRKCPFWTFLGQKKGKSAKKALSISPKPLLVGGLVTPQNDRKV